MEHLSRGTPLSDTPLGSHTATPPGDHPFILILPCVFPRQNVTQFISVNPTADSDAVCTDLTVCDASDGLVVKQAPTPTTDRVCTLRGLCIGQVDN